MNWTFRIVLALIAIGIVGGIAAGIEGGWDWDRDRTVEYRIVREDTGGAAGDRPVIVVERDHDFPRRAFFPVIPLVFVGGALVVIGLATRGGGPGGPGRWGYRGFEEWHRTAHATPEPPSTGGTPQ